MAKYYVTSPEGVNYELDGPEGATQEQAIAVAQQLKAQGKLREANKERTLGEAFTDPLAGIVKGTGAMAQLPGQLYGLATGDFDTAAMRGPEALKKYGESLQSQGYKVREALANKAISEAGKQGIISEFMTAITQTLKDPALITSFISEQLPELVPALLTGGGSKLLTTGAKQLAKYGTKDAMEAAAAKTVMRTAIGTGAVQQGAGVGSDTYEEALKLLEKQYPNMPEQERKNIALNKARVAALEGGAISLAAQRLPGARAIERKIAKLPGEGRIRGALGEAASEIAEEGGGKFASNVGLQEIDPTHALSTGVGQAAGMGALGGGTMGGLLGKQKTPEAAVPPGTPGAPTPIEQAQLDKAAAEAAAQAKAEAAAKAKLDKAAAKATKKEAEEQAKIDAANAAVPQGGNLDIAPVKSQWTDIGTPPKRGDVQTDLFGNPVVPTAVEPVEEAGEPTFVATAGPTLTPEEQAAKDAALAEQKAAGKVAKAAQNPTVEEQDKQRPIPGLETFPVSHLVGQGVPKNSTMVRAYAAEGTNAVDLSDPKAVETLIGRLSGWIKASKGNPKPEIQNAVKEFSNVIPMLRQHLESLPTTEEAPSAKPTVESPSGAGVSVASEPGTETTPGGTGTVDTSGVVSTEPDVGEPPTGEGQQPVAVDETPVAETPPAVETPAEEVPPVETPAKPAVFTAPDIGTVSATNRKPQPKSVIQVDLDTALDSKKKSAAYRATRPGFYPPPMLASIQRLITASERGDSNATQALKSFEPAEVDAARNYKSTLAAESAEEVTPDHAESQRMDDALRGKTFDEALAFAIKNASDAGQKAILQKAGRRIQELKAKGFEFAFRLAGKGQELTNNALGLVQRDYSGLGQATRIEMILNGATGQSNTLRQDILAHELVHTATAAMIDFAPLSGAARQLRNLQQEVVEEFNRRAKAGTLNAWEKRIYEGRNNALKDAHELLAWGLTDKNMQNWLASMEDKSGKSWLSKLYDIVSNVLNLNGKEKSVLARLMSISEDIFVESLEEYQAQANKEGKSFGKQANTTGYPSWALKYEGDVVWAKGNIALYKATAMNGNTIYIAGKEGVGQTRVDIRSFTGNTFTPEEQRVLKQAADSMQSTNALISSPGNIAAAQQTNIVNLNGPASILQNAQQALQGGSAEKVRVAFADRLAALDKKLFQGYGGKIRDAFGNVNPSVLLAQALDFLRVGENSLLLGGLGKTTDQLYAATDLTLNPDGTGGPANMQEIFRIIIADAKAGKKDFKQTLHAVGTMLVGHREHALRAYNALPTTTDPIVLKLTDAQIDDLEARYQASPETQKILAIMDAMRFNRIDMMVDAGRISPDKAQMWKDNTAYVPYDSMDAALEKAMTKGTGAGKGLSGVAAYRSLGGSTVQVGDPVKAFMDQMIRMTGDAMRVNAVSKSLRDLTLLGHAKRAYKAAQNPAEAKYRVKTYINGVPVEYHVDDPLDVAAFAGMPSEVPDILQAMQKVTQTLRAGVTLMPGFALSQLIQDTVRAYAFSEVMNPAALIPRTLMNFPRIAFGELTGMKSKVVKEMERLGIVGNYDTTTHTTIKNILLEQGVEKRGIIGSILHIGESLSKASDLSVRQAIYEQTLKETISPQRPTGDQALAETRAREIINFSRRGDNNTLNFLTRTVPFMGAYTRGLDKLYTAATGGTNAYGLTTKEARNLFIKRMGTLSAMGLAYALMMAGDEGYEEQPDYVRDGNIILPGAKQLGFLPAIPMPRDLGFVFLAMPQRLVQYMRKNGTPEEQTGVRVIGELMRQGLATIASPNITPVAIRPILENLVNYSFFMDRPLESQAQMQMESFERFGTGTSSTAKALSKGAYDISQSLQNMGFSKSVAGVVEISPIKLENLFRGILGTTAEMTTAMADMMVNPTRTDRPLHKSIAAMVTGATAIMKDPVGRRQLNDLYDLSNETKMAKNTFDRLEKDDPVAAEEYARTHYAEIQMNDYVAGLMKDINDLRNDAHMVDISTDIPSDERQRITSEITRQQNMIAHDVYVLRAAMGKERRMLNP